MGAFAPRNWESYMTIIEMIKQGVHYARTCKSLWLFGFFVGIASGGSNGGGGGGGHDDSGGVAAAVGAIGAVGASGGDFLNLSVAQIAPIVIVAIVVILAFVVLRFIGEGALIEGVVRARQGGTMTTREGFRAGWAHWGVLVRIALLYLAATCGSMAVLAAPCVIAMLTLGPIAAVLVGIPLLIIAVPWLVTLYLVQAFAWRIAVLENRHALDAIRKARLFLHGRLLHGLKLIVATFIGSLGFAFAAAVVMVPVVLLLVALIQVLNVWPVVIIACVVLLPMIYVLSAMLGTFRSSVWTIGYVTEVPQVES
jgi:hypothetical protein